MPVLRSAGNRGPLRSLALDGHRLTGNRDLPAEAGEDAPSTIHSQAARQGWLVTCANPGCRTGWLHLWRSRSSPIFEAGWTCPPNAPEYELPQRCGASWRAGWPRPTHTGIAFRWG